MDRKNKTTQVRTLALKAGADVTTDMEILRNSLRMVAILGMMLLVSS